MSLEELTNRSSRQILILEDIKRRLEYDHEQIQRYALEAAQAEDKVYEAEKDSDVSGQDLAITLISRASCLVDASQIQEALEVFRRAHEYAQIDSLKDWISEEVRAIQAHIDDAPDYQLSSQHEYRFVERPFLDQLESLGWEVIDHGLGIPHNPQQSFRENFREVVLKQIFKREIRRINIDEQDNPWLTDQQLDELYKQIAEPRLGGAPSLQEANEHLHKQLIKNHPLQDEQGRQQDAWFFNFKEPTENHFLAINQFRIDTPHGVKNFIIPDIVLFVNGIPLAVIECKEASRFSANPMHEAYKQLQRYSEQREATRRAGLREGEERLFYTNLLMIRTTGEKADFGTITSSERYYFPWREIYPESLRDFEPPLGKQRAQETLIQGVLSKANLLDLLHCCTVFMDIGINRIKAVARHQQFTAMQKIINRIRTEPTPERRSGVVWHTQGSGKSLTMVFTIRKLRASDDLKDFKVILINDRLDLEEQLTRTARLTGETPRVVEHTDEVLRLRSDSSDLNLVMIHKFQRREQVAPAYFKKELDAAARKIRTFGELNPSEKILIMVDEAHRSQYSDLGNNLFEAFPNATKIAFTGTPIIVKEKRRTTRRFGSYIDRYPLQEAVDDGATLKIIYEGRAVDMEINEKSVFEHRFLDLCRDLTPKQEAIVRKRYGTTEDIFEAEARVGDVATDLVDHYIDHILPNGFKAQVVCNSKLAAVRCERAIQRAIQSRLEKEQGNGSSNGLAKQIAFLKTAVILSEDSANDPAEVVEAIRRSNALNPVENFLKPFDLQAPNKENTGIAFLVVCDRLLTGFDAPIEQVMYIDKKIRHHSLLQAIARVNRVAPGKTRGYVVDYVGLANHLKEALAIYASEDIVDIADNLKSIESELPELESHYHRLLHLFADNGVERIEAFVRQQMKDVQSEFETAEAAIDCLEDPRLRASFENYYKDFMQSMDIILPDPVAQPYRIPAKQFGYILARTKQRYRDDSLSLEGIGEKVRQLINEHLISLGINPKIDPIELLSDQFINTLSQNKDPKARAIEMEHAIRKHCKVHFERDPALYSQFVRKLEVIIEQLKDNWEAQLEAFSALRDEIDTRPGTSVEGLTDIEAVIYRRIVQIAFGDESTIPEEYVEPLKTLTQEVLRLLKERINIVNFWKNDYEVERLEGSLDDLMVLSSVSPVRRRSDHLAQEVAYLAKVREPEILSVAT